MGTTVRDLLDFLEEAELSQYYNALSTDLKITTIPQLKYVEEDDLTGIGMTKPEMRRLKRHYKKECPQGALGRLKKAILSKTGNDGLGRSLSPSPPEQRSNRSSSRLSSYIRPPSKQIIPADAILVNKTLGEGEFGVVQQGVWTTENGEKVQVAIKCLSKEKLQNGTTEFLKEAGIMQTIDHDNIVRMFGVVLDKENSMMLVTELAPMRSLLECLKEATLRLDFPLSRLCDFAQQICDGMSYLENKRLIHRDLAARNILVFSKNKVKISDFGLSRALGAGKDYYQSNFSINLKLPIAWCAPECINYLKFTSASDVWAFGVTMWELFSYGFQPWAGMTGQQILDAIDSPNSQRLDRPDLCPKEYYDLMYKCWDHDSAKRPTFSDMLIQLPLIRPVQMKAVKDFPEITVPRDYLYYKASDIIFVIDKNPENAPSFGLCRGVLNSGKAGFFDPTNCTPVMEAKSSPVTSLPKPSISRKESKRSSSRKLRAEMISGPKNDLRHTGHIGYDGAMFGDVSFIGDNYDKLPVNVGTGSAGDRMSSFSLHRQSPDRDSLGISLNGGTNGVGTNGLNHSWISQESIDSTFKDETDGDRTPHYQDIEDDSLFSDFKMPDIGSSFDFGGSFMDEVLKALNEKEAKIEASSPSDNSTPSPDGQFTNSFDDRSRSISPPSVKEFKHSSPPPLPSQPPRSDTKKEPPKPEPRKQAKVKPMSASEQKMMDDAIALANEFAAQSQVADTPTSPTGLGPDRTRSDSESGSESPKLISKLKNSFKRSPKLERKRTFSEEIAQKGEITEDVPPEAQEAYNILVVRGSVKEDKKERPQHPPPVVESKPRWESSRSTTESKPWETSRFTQDSKSSWQSSRSASESKPSWESSRSTTESKSLWETSRSTSESKPLWETSRLTSEAKPSWESSRSTSQSRPSWESSRSMSETKPSWESSSPVSESRTSWEPPKKSGVNSFKSNVPLASTEEVELFVDLDPVEKVDPPPRPVPKPRVEIPKKYESSIPSPKQRPEIHRVDPVPRPQQPPPRIPMTSAVADLQSDLNESFGSSHSVGSNQSFGKDSYRSGGSEILRIQEDRDEVSERTSVRSSDFSDSDDPKKHVEVLRIDLPDSAEYNTDSSSSKELHIEEAPRRDSSSKSSSLFDEEFSEPSPREIMNKLARESRIRRSLDHQRGLMGDMGEPAPNRNLREPQGIPGKTMSTSNGDDDEVDTNPLRMLRGGAIPIRGGRVGQGNSRPPLLPPKLQNKKPQFHHSMSVDSGTSHVKHVGNNSLVNGDVPTSCVNGNVDVVPPCRELTVGAPGRCRPPAVPPRSYSISDDGRSRRNQSQNPLPLPPRSCSTRSGNLNTKPRERKYPLLLDETDDYSNNHEGRISNQSSSVLSSSVSSVPAVDVTTSSSSSTVAWAPAIPARHGRPSYLRQPSDLPPAPALPTPTQNFDETSDDSSDDGDNVDDSVFDNESSPVVHRKLSSENFTVPLNSRSGSSTFPRVKFRLNNDIKCNLEQLGFYNRQDPFWVKSLILAGERISDREGSEEISPLMLANYKSSDGVSYEDLLDFALDREKNCEEIETMQKIFGSEVSVQDCTFALEETKWDVQRAIKYVKLKQLLSAQLGDAHFCKEALMTCDWDVQRAANFMLSSPLPSPECVDV